jgi:hypothetical protein
MITMTKYKRCCPFCGKKDDIRVASNPHGVFLFCKICSARGPALQTEEEAWAAWEIRVAEDRLRLQIADLEKTVREMRQYALELEKLIPRRY